ncbi:hypothetical protein BDZ85DRAFT_282717 [Elsinoe ampelina]|uniref:Rhodopsin domain-containing protein n=1 Tax=Elsinoe ampelina TaxID=302913 RepID=A0A6A6GAA1_9PEZI|nr:hypothetical protein BDZ85DRAFT_282717 [Elsinoe ampelina]
MAPSTAIGCQIACILLVLLAWLSILLRLYTRLFVVRAPSADDWSILLTTIIFTFFSALVFSTVHASTTLPLNLSRAATLLFASSNLSIITTITLKISLTLFFLRLLPRPTHRPHRLILSTTTTSFLLLSTVYFFLTLFNCGDPRHHLESQLAGQCLDKHRVTIPATYAYSSLNALTNCVFIAIPLPVVVAKSHLPPRARAVLTALLILGATASVCALVRIAFVHLLDAEPPELFKTAYDVGALSVVEVGLGIVASSLATLGPLVSSWEIEGFETRGRGGSDGSDGRTPVAMTGQMVGTGVGETEKGLMQEVKEAEGRIEARRGGRDVYASEDLEVEVEEEDEPVGQGREDAMRKKSIAVVNEVIVESEEATPEELEDMRGPRKTKRWSVAPRISMSWMRSSWAVDRGSKVVS